MRTVPIELDESEEGLWLVLKRSDCEKMVQHAERGEGFALVEIMKRQPWWNDLSFRLRAAATAAAILMAFASCATAPDPATVQQYADLAHSAVHNGISDYKEIRPLIK